MRCPPGNRDEVAALSLWLLSVVLLIVCMSIPEYVVQESDLRCDDGRPLQASSQQGAFYRCVSYTTPDSSCRSGGVNISTSTHCEQLQECSSGQQQESLVSGLNYSYDPCAVWHSFRAFLVVSLLLSAPTVALCCLHLHRHGTASAAPYSGAEQLYALWLSVLSVLAGLLSIISAVVLYGHEQPVLGFYFYAAQGPAIAVGASFFLQCIACCLTLAALLPWARQRRRQMAAAHQLQQQQDAQQIAALSDSASAPSVDEAAAAASGPPASDTAVEMTTWSVWVAGAWRSLRGALSPSGEPFARQRYLRLAPSSHDGIDADVQNRGYGSTADDDRRQQI